MQKRKQLKKILHIRKSLDHNLIKSFEMLHFQIDYAFSTEEALIKLSTHDYALLLLDTDTACINTWLILRFIEYYLPNSIRVIYAHQCHFDYAIAKKNNPKLRQAILPKGLAPIKLAWLLRRLKCSRFPSRSLPNKIVN